MKILTKLILLCKLFLVCNLLIAQEFERFEDFKPLKELKCGLWLNSNGNIAYKDMAAAPPDLADSFDVVDYYISWTYNGLDSINEYMTSLKDIVDTASFQFIGDFYFKDKNYVYILTTMVYGGNFSIYHSADVETFKALDNPFYACDKNICFHFGREIEGADAKTFELISTKDAPYISKDKNYYYKWCEVMTNEDVLEFKKELRIMDKSTIIPLNYTKFVDSLRHIKAKKRK